MNIHKFQVKKIGNFEDFLMNEQQLKELLGDKFSELSLI